MVDERLCAVCTKLVVANAPGGGALVCPHCTERLVDRWAEANPGVTVQEWLTQHDLSASCIFWHANPDAVVKATRCEDCSGVVARLCNQPLLARDPHNIIPGRCGAFDCCCDGNLVVDKRGVVDGTHTRCHTFRRRELFRAGSRLRLITE